MHIFTSFGFIASCMIFAYWCFDEQKGYRLGITILLSFWINLVLNHMLAEPNFLVARYTVVPDQPPLFMSNDPLSATGGIARFPSIYTQNSLVFYMIIASWGKNKWLYLIAAAFCIFIGLSYFNAEVYSNVDAIGGWVFAILILCAHFFTREWIEAFFAMHSPRVGLISYAILAFAMIQYLPSIEFLMPAGLFLGLGIGYFLCQHYIGLTALTTINTQGQTKFRILLFRFALGFITLFLLYTASERLIAGFEETENYQLFYFTRFIIIAIWVAAGVPWLFRTMRLYSSEQPTEQ